MCFESFCFSRRSFSVPLKDSRNGMIWLYDMASATCTSALSCHSQQVRLQIVSTGRWQKRTASG